ncbi:MAG: cytochrome c3 family protein [Gemmatimonadota bacterium]|jgi:predicted CXXCH cytochrome family protein
MRTPSERAALLTSAVLALAALSACVDESAIFDDRDLFIDPPTEAGSFLGYSDRDSKLIVCGNCHVEKQGEWQRTAHASAWDGLQSSGFAEESCEACHTVNGYGNPVAEDAGWITTGDERFQDVQCESCHGPGLTHVTNPLDTNAPLASLKVGIGLTNGCGECHSDAHHPFLQEWESSRHANLYTSVASRPECAACHTGDGAMEAWGVSSVFLEQQAGGHFAITCAVCHDPHGSDNSKQLRFSINTASLETNLCMKCHQRLGNPDLNEASAGPHSPQGPLLVGTAGWWPPNLQWQKFVGSHGMTESNPRLCAGCHVVPFEVADAAADGQTTVATGHIFTPIPCLDAEGRPIASGNCPDTERSFLACAASGCHTDEADARSDKALAEARLSQLSSALRSLLDQVPGSEFNNSDQVYTTAEGAEFNRKLARGGAAVHNPFLTEALLLASIDAVRIQYGVALQVEVSMEPIFATGGTP